MSKQQVWIEWIRSLPIWVKGAIALVAGVAGLIVALRSDYHLYVTIMAVGLLVALTCALLYVAFARTASPFGGKGAYRFERYRPLAFLGIVMLLLVVVAALAFEPSRSFVVTALTGTPTPIPASQVELLFTTDEIQSRWYKVADRHLWKQYMPDYMQYVGLNQIVEHYDSLTSDDKRLFRVTFEFLRDKAESDPRARINVADEETERFKAMGVVDFYKYFILYQRWYGFADPDAIEEVCKDEIIGDLLERDGLCPGDGFYVYDYSLCPVAWHAVEALWPSSAELEQLEIDDPYLYAHLRKFNTKFLRTYDPIIDFVVMNNAEQTLVLHELEVRILDWWNEVKAGPMAGALKSVAAYNVQLDFGKEVNRFDLDPPLYVHPGGPVRFKLRLSDFLEKAKGNMALVKFVFQHNMGSLESPVILLDY